MINCPLHRTENYEDEYYVYNNKMYDILLKSHKETGHYRVLTHYDDGQCIKNNYVSISRPFIQLVEYNIVCNACIPLYAYSWYLYQ